MISKEVALGELEALAEGRAPRNHTLLAEFLQCPDSQEASNIISGAASRSQFSLARTPLLAPPGLLPPIL